MCPRSCFQFIWLHSSKQFFMQIWAADVTHACVNTSMCLQRGRSSDLVLLNNDVATRRRSRWSEPFCYSLFKTLWRVVTPSLFRHSRGLTHKYEQNKIRWLKWLQPQLCPHCPVPRRGRPCSWPGCGTQLPTCSSYSPFLRSLIFVWLLKQFRKLNQNKNVHVFSWRAAF